MSKRFGRATALDDVSLTVNPGEVVALIGPSGAGKSTLFRCVTRLTRPDTGRIEVFGTDVARLAGGGLRETRRLLGLVFQQFNLIGRISAVDNVLVGRLGCAPTWRVLTRRFSSCDRQIALAALDRVGLLDLAYQRADSLSGGQQQRVAVARVLAQEAAVILADEPVSSLDPGSAETVLEILRDVARKQELAVLCSLHQVDWARRYADRIVGLRDGRIGFDRRAEDLDERTTAALYA